MVRDGERQWIRDIQKRRAGDSADLLISAYYDEIYVYAYKQTHDKETAMDLTQDIFVAMLCSINLYDAGKSSFRTWLYKIATNKVIDFKRRARPGAVPLDDVEIPVDIDYEALSANRDLIAKIEGYVSCLAPERQEVFRLKVFGDLTFAQIADMLQKPESSVKSIYYRLISELRREFDDEYTDAEQ